MLTHPTPHSSRSIRRIALATTAGALLTTVAHAAPQAAPLTRPGSLGLPTTEFAQVLDHGPDLLVSPSTGQTYVARGTLPLRDGWQFTETCPFGLRRGDRIYPAQWSPVAWDADGELAVVELAATVDRLPGDLEQEQVAFDVVRVEPGFPAATPTVPLGTLAVAAAKGSSFLRVLDSLGNEYVGALSQNLSSPDSEVEVLGRAKGVYRTQGSLVRISGPGGTSQRAGGFHAWFTFHSGSPAIELDLQWHNATAGAPHQMAPDILFESAQLLLPVGWNSTLKWPYPEQGATYASAFYDQPFAVVELVRDGPTPHILRQRGRLTWRTVLWPEGQSQEALARLEQRGWGVARGPVNGWQDPLSARWLAQQALLPDLAYLESAYDAELSDTRAAIEQALTDGTPYYYDGVGRMGPYHSYGTPYGGMTGGDEIDQTPGAALMWTGNRDGLLAYQQLHRMLLDRQYGWVFDPSGKLIEVRDLVQPDGSLPVNFFSNDFIQLPYLDDLGFGAVPNPYAELTPRPEYEDAFIGTTPYDGLDQHDAQHGARATWPQKVLIWAANDRMARHDLAAQAAVWQMEMHDGPGGRLNALREWATAHPGVAGNFGRGEGWIVDAVTHWYALTEPTERDHFQPWFEAVLDTLLKLQSPLGVFYGTREGKVLDYYDFNYQFAIIQWYEQAIGLHAVACLLRSWADEPAREAALGELLVDGALAIWRYGWKPNTVGTWEQQAVAPFDPTLPAYENLEEIPPVGFGGGPGNDQIAGPLAYALPYAKPLEFVELYMMAQALAQNENPLEGLQNLYPYYLAIENRAPLLAWMQVILGG